MKFPLYALTTALVLAAAAPATLTAASSDEAAIRQQSANFVAAWNKHDPQAMAACWAADGNLINPFGRAATSRAELEKLFTAEHDAAMRGTTYATKEVSVHLLAPTVAISEWSSVITGMHDPNGAALPPLEHRVVVILEKRNGEWQATIGRPYAFLPPPSTS